MGRFYDSDWISRFRVYRVVNDNKFVSIIAVVDTELNRQYYGSKNPVVDVAFAKYIEAIAQSGPWQEFSEIYRSNSQVAEALELLDGVNYQDIELSGVMDFLNSMEFDLSEDDRRSLVIAAASYEHAGFKPTSDWVEEATVMCEDIMSYEVDQALKTLTQRSLSN